jgi:hypothetical protein
MPPTDMSAPLNNTWGQSVAEGTVVRLTLPSGNQCDAERTGIEGAVKAGILSEGDSLTDIVDRKHVRRVRGGKGADREEVDVQSLMSDPAGIGKIVMTVDRALVHIIKNPPVALHFHDLDEPDPKTGAMTRRLPADERKDGLVYTDQVPLEDKMFLFNWAVGGGTPDAERFRHQSASAVAGVADGEGVRRKAKRGPRRKG